ncbi:serine/threonine-protein phosphatase [Nocardioides panacis]|uniref:Serine/threonine-protein phosphatase n=1 Tax=Nocardioides panacis TaxID=2849501 RepID=A0A975T2Y0_9ACTN|nr:PP2C family protein-serine/threonine phosphatase [Nocardioides panacis]QWZ10020.1 serine/threonine-protein phosphatase [Nocardioides panacis]
MRSDRFAPAVGAGLATFWLAVLVILDVAVDGSSVVLSPLFALAPLIACAVLPVRTTAVFAAATVTAVVVSGFWDGTWGLGQHTVRIVDVLLISGAAVVVAWVRVRRERQLARVEAIAEVAQRAVLPTLPTHVGEVSLGARYQSAARDALVGGDLYDFYSSEGRVRMLVGDVRGKGVGAVEQAARVIRAFRQAAGTKATLQALAEDMSAYLAPFFDDEEFVTAVLVDVSDPAEVSVVSCGHPPALLVRSGGSSVLEGPVGLPLGLGDTYEAFTVPWEHGDRLLLYTDGLSEARDEHGTFPELSGLAPLIGVGTVDAALDAVLDAVRRHVAGGRLGDDLAVMLLENTAGTPPAQVATVHADIRVSSQKTPR